jgi:hypothetical protein
MVARDSPVSRAISPIVTLFIENLTSQTHYLKIAQRELAASWRAQIIS